MKKINKFFKILFLILILIPILILLPNKDIEKNEKKEIQQEEITRGLDKEEFQLYSLSDEDRRLMPQMFTWSYQNTFWTLITSIDEERFHYYITKPRDPHPGIHYVTSEDPFIKKISKELSEKATENISEVWVAISFVRNISYINDSFIGYWEYPKYPVETFFEKNGDCEDTSYLLASILTSMGYDCILIELPGHLAVGLEKNCESPGDYYKLGNKCYYYIETVGRDMGILGERIPERFRQTCATLIEIPSGKTSEVKSSIKKFCYPSLIFIGYYYSDNNFYSDNQCKNLTSCVPYKSIQGVYFDYHLKKFYWDDECLQSISYEKK